MEKESRYSVMEVEEDEKEPSGLMEEKHRTPRVNVAVTGATGFLGHNLIEALLRDPRVGEIHTYSRKQPPWELELSNFTKCIPCPTKMQQGWGWFDEDRDCNIFTSSTGVPYKLVGRPGEDSVEKPDDNVPIISVLHKSLFDNDRVKQFAGDINDEEKLAACFKGCSIVFHLCGDTRWWNAINEEQRRTNVNGPTTAYRVACRVGTVTKFIHTSTIDVMGPNPTLDECRSMIDETAPFGYAGMGYHYAETKRKGEIKLISEYFRNSAINDLVILRPCSMIGPWDVTNQYGRLFGEIKKGMVGIPAGGTVFCNVKEVVRVYLEVAFDVSQDLRIYTCGGVRMTYKEFFDLLAKQMSVKRVQGISRICTPPPVIPMWLLVFYGWLCELVSWFTGKHPEINPGMARYMSVMATCEDTCDELHAEGETYVLEHGIRDSYNWYARRGKI